MAVRKVKLVPGKSLDRGAIYRRGKPSVEQAYRVALAAVNEEFEDVDFTEMQQLALVAPPPRPGYVQMFRRVMLGGESDWRNEITTTQAQWTPRIDEVTNNRALQIGDMVLMERPIEIHKRTDQYLAQRKAALLESIINNDYTDKLSGGNGFGPLTVSRSDITEDFIPMVEEEE